MNSIFCGHVTLESKLVIVKDLKELKDTPMIEFFDKLFKSWKTHIFSKMAWITLSDKISADKFPGFLFHLFNMSFIIICPVLNFNWQNISADKIFGSKLDFRQFSPPIFCPIRYTFKDLLNKWIKTNIRGFLIFL